jgi:hypothetical protein
MAAKADPAALTALLDRSGDAATVAWVHEGRGNVAALSDPALAILAAERVGNIAALQGVQQPKDLRKAAAAALHRMRSRGVEVTEKVAPKSFTLGAESVDLRSRAFLSLPDRDGDIELLLTASDLEGHCVLATVFGGQDLVRDSQHAHLNRSGLRDLWAQVEGRGMHAELPFVAGLHYADRFVKGHDRHGFDHFLDHVPPGVLQSARILDPLARLPAPKFNEPDPPRWLAPVGLLNLLEIEKHVGSMMQTMASELHLDEEGRKRAIDDAFAEAADAALDEPARKRLDLYLELVVAGALHYGWPKTAATFEAHRKDVAEGAPGRKVGPVYAAAQFYIAKVITGVAQEVGADPEG